MIYSTFDIAMDELLTSLRHIRGSTTPSHSLSQRASEALFQARALSEFQSIIRKFLLQWITASDSWIGALDQTQRLALQSDPLGMLPMVIVEFKDFSEAHGGEE